MNYLQVTCVNQSAMCFLVLFGFIGETVVVEEENGPTSSGNANQGYNE